MIEEQKITIEIGVDTQGKWLGRLNFSDGTTRTTEKYDTRKQLVNVINEWLTSIGLKDQLLARDN